MTSLVFWNCFFRWVGCQAWKVKNLFSIESSAFLFNILIAMFNNGVSISNLNSVFLLLYVGSQAKVLSLKRALKALD